MLDKKSLDEFCEGLIRSAGTDVAKARQAEDHPQGPILIQTSQIDIRKFPSPLEHRLETALEQGWILMATVVQRLTLMARATVLFCQTTFGLTDQLALAVPVNSCPLVALESVTPLRSA